VVVWGHNEHFGRTPHLVYGAATKSTGAYLAEAFGDRYFAIGSTVFEGTFWAVQYSSGTGFIREQTMEPASPSDIATYFHAASLPELFVPLRGRIPSWLIAPRTIRIAGSNVQSPRRATVTFTLELAKKFDAMVYVERSTPTHLRHFPSR
jgi:erythromycin esterase-like protein